MSLNRRNLLKASALAAPTIVSANAFAGSHRVAPSDRITIGIIGCGKMANNYHIPQLLRQKDTQVVAVCEVDKTRRDHALKRVNRHYAGKSKSKKE